MRRTLLWLCCLAPAAALVPVFAASVAVEPAAPTKLDLPNVLTKVAVTGATGRTGRLVVQELLRQEVSTVVAIVRDTDKAAEVFPNPPANLEIVQCDLLQPKQIERVLQGVDATIWCATGFSSNQQNTSILSKLKSLFGVVTKRTIDTVGLPAIGALYAGTDNEYQLPKLVLCSSAGVTRPIWDDDKKARFPGAADIPIVRLNPFGILDVKRESEDALRATGVDYCIVRPAGLNDDWPTGSRPLFSQGDVAVGRIHRQDVADVLVQVLTTPEATGKTFEMISLAGYPKPSSIAPALARLLPDKEGLPPLESIAATYATMQQLLPGETQNAAALAMGQTYEQLDRGEQGRLGERGKENVEGAGLRPSQSE